MTTPTLNPFKELRETHNFTVELMAAKIGITKQALIRLEQGTYAEPLPTALTYCASAFPISEYELTLRYEAYQIAQRQKNRRYFGDFKDFHSEVHPMRLLRGTTNPTQVAKDLCIPQATLTYFERNVVQQKSVPKVIVNVMHEIGYSDAEISYFKEAYEVYRQRLVAKRTEQGKRVDYGYVPKQRSKQSRSTAESTAERIA